MGPHRGVGSGPKRLRGIAVKKRMPGSDTRTHAPKMDSGFGGSASGIGVGEPSHKVYGVCQSDVGACELGGTRFGRPTPGCGFQRRDTQKNWVSLKV